MRTCTAIIPSTGHVCGRPARGRQYPGNTPLCGIHLRSVVLSGGGVEYDEPERQTLADFDARMRETEPARDARNYHRPA